MMEPSKCPNCGRSREHDAAECPGCGIIFAKLRERELRKASPPESSPEDAAAEEPGRARWPEHLFAAVFFVGAAHYLYRDYVAGEPLGHMTPPVGKLLFELLGPSFILWVGYAFGIPYLILGVFGYLGERSRKRRTD